MADADVPANPDADAPADGAEATVSTRWLDGLLWDTPPDTGHLKKFQPRTQAAVPETLVQGFAHVESIDVLGLPAGAGVINATEVEPGTWRLNDNAGGRFAVQSARDAGADGPVKLTIKVTGAETEGDEVVSLLGSLDLELPKRHTGPLFRDLPDMVRAREREERQRQAAEEARQEAERLAAEEAAAQKAAEEAAAEKAAEEAAAEKAAEEAAAQKAAEEKAAREAEKKTAEARPQPRPARRAAVTLQPVTKDEPARAPAAAKPATKPQRRAAVTLQPVEPPPTPKPKAEEKPPARRPRRRAAVTLQPMEPEPERPQPQPKPAQLPRRRAAVTLQPVEPEKPAAPKKSGATWSKPIRRTPEPAAEPVETGEPALPHTESIGVELGGAPEVGDPHFRLLVDGRQVLDGNIDWGIGMPASDADSGELCWQMREIAWDFAGGAPDTIVLRFDDNGAGEAAEGTLLARAITVDGLSIDADGPYARYPDGRCPWAGRAERLSWHGDLVFNVAGARRGDPDYQPQERGEIEPSSAAAPAPTAKAIPKKPPAAATGDDLNEFDEALADAREIMEIADAAAQRVLSGVSDLILDVPEADPADAIMPVEIPDDLVAILMPPPDGGEIRDVFLAERLARADAERQQRAQPDEEAPPLHRIAPEEGAQLREAFFTAWEIRADTRTDAQAVTVIDMPGKTERPAAMTPGRAVGDEFLTGRLKTALQRLQAAPKMPAGGDAAPPEQTGARAEAAALSAAFLDETLARARARMSAVARTAPA